MAENPQLNCDSASLSISCELGGLEKLGSLKMKKSDDEGSSERGERSDNFVVDMESLGRGVDKDITVNSRVTLQRSLSRKGSHRAERKSSISTTNDKETADEASKAALIGACLPENSVIVPLVMEFGIKDPINTQRQVKTAKVASATAAEGRCSGRRFSWRRPFAWVFDPRKVLFFCATLSSMGTIILLYFTLSMANLNGDVQQQ